MAQQNIIHAKDLRPNNTFVYKNNLYLVIENSFNKTAMREGIVKCKVKNLRTNAITIEVLTGEKLEKAVIDKIKAIYVYPTNDAYVFMDNTTFEQFEINKKFLKWEANFLKDGLEINVLKYENEILNISLPEQIALKVTFAEEAVQGNSVQSALKKAVLETNYELEVPQFVKTGDEIIVNTVSGKYVSKHVSKK